MKVIYTKKRLCVFRSVLCFLVFLIGFFPPISVFAQDTLQVTSSQGILYEKTEKPLPSYAALMREFRAVQLNKNFNGKSFDSNEQAIRKSALLKNLERFLKKEREADNLLTVFDEKKQTLYSQIEAQIHELGGSTGFMDTVEMFVKEIFGVKTSDFSSIDETTSRDVSVPENPGTFTSSNENPVIQDIDNARATLSPGQEIPSGLQKLITIEEVFAAELPLPVLDDVKGDEAEAFISEEIKSLARDLDNNPVKINNYLTKTLQYEPYWGAKKGSVGCLRERFCNDVDATSLAISLYRAAGIPAHYKKGFVLVSAERFKNLLGVNDVKATFLALSLAKVPVYVLSDALNGKFLSDADFSNEKFFAMEWTHPEIFIEYDERAGNTFNTLSFEDATSTEGLREALLAYPKKEWIPTDVIFGLLKRSQSDDVLGSISFDARAFFSQYLKGTSGTSPLNALDTAVSQIANNRHILTDQSARTTFTRKDLQLSVLPPALPYIHVQGIVNGNPAPAAEIWSKLPDAKRTTVTISLLRASDISTVLEKTFFGSEINNQETILSYVGATDADKQTIDEYGGIAQTPAALVDIMPALDVDMIHADGSRNVKIGETLILKFSYIRNGTVAYTDEKFSVAGNQEGIYIALSHINHDASLDTNQHILLRGNVGIARTYLEDVTNDVQTLSEVLGHPLIVEFTRAVVTENRILTEINSLPTTFDFKGLSIDASAYINDYSARDGYLAHRKDFHLLYGLIGSYYEQATLTRVTGLSSISTVSGLQYAYANPSVYTVSEITKANESVIDSLNLSDNTKANMHADVGKGNTVITPNTLVQKGNWKGILYISLKSDYTGQYAIGEQTAGNGGWTVDAFDNYEYIDDQGTSGNANIVHMTAINNTPAKEFSYTDGRLESKMCIPDQEEVNAIMSASYWKSSYGRPCYMGFVRFGSKAHEYIIGYNGVHFRATDGSFDYWEYLGNIFKKMDAYVQEKKSLSGDDFRRLQSGINYNAWFSTTLGVPVRLMCEVYNYEHQKCAVYASVYYTPYKQGNDQGRVYRIRGPYLGKLALGNNAIMKKIGYPTSDEEKAADSNQFKSSGSFINTFQDFANGQVYDFSVYYVFTARHSTTVFTYGRLTDIHNANNGTWGILGFPQRDPVEKDNYVYQLFENNKEIGWDTAEDDPLKDANVEGYQKFRCQLNGEIGSRWYDGISMTAIQLVGILDSGVSTVVGLGQLIWMTGGSIVNIDSAPKKLSEYWNEIKKLNFNKLKSTLGAAGSSMGTALIHEYDTSVGKSGCAARTWYLQGHIGGEALQILIPADKFNLLTKLKIFNRAELVFGELKIVGKIGKYGKVVAFQDAKQRDALNAILKITNSNDKGVKAEEFLNTLVNGTEKYARYPTTNGDRIVDVISENGVANVIANEVKAWKSKVSLTKEIERQIDKDVEIMLREGPENYRPVWHFLEGEPTGPLLKKLEENSIEYIIYK